MEGKFNIICYICEITNNFKNIKMDSINEILGSGDYHLIDVREPMELEMDGKLAPMLEGSR